MTACEERYFGGEQNVSTNKSTFTTIYNQETLAGTDGLLFLKMLPQKLFFVVSPLAGLSESQVVIRCTCCSSCFPYVSSFISKKAQQGRLLFLKKLPQKLFFVVSLSAGLSELRLLYVVLVVQVVFPISARRPSKKPQHKVLTNQLTPD